MIPQHVTNYAVWLEGRRLLGMADCTLANLVNLADDLKGASYFGSSNIPVQAHFDAMSITLNFHTITADACSLARQDGRDLDIRSAHQYHTSSTNKITQQGFRVITSVLPKGINLGVFEVGVKGGVSVELEVITIRVLHEERILIELDKENGICNIDGVDYGIRIRRLLGL
jgi:uncharacterized protein